MAGILDYSTTPSSNTKINGIGIAGSDSIKNGDNAMRQMMADTRAAVTKASDKAAGSYTAAKADHNQLWRVTGTATVNLTAAATLTAGWCLWVMADGATATITPAGSEQVNGAATLTLVTGNSALIICTGTDFKAVVFTNPAALGGAAYLNVGTTTGTVAAGDDSRITGALPKSGGTMTGAITLAGDPTSNMQATTKQYVDASAFSHAKEIITASGTWTKPAGIPDNQPILVEIWGGGGGGGNNTTASNNGSSGGGGGGYWSHVFLASELASSVAIVIGAGGALKSTGGSSSFGDYTAYGGGGGNGGGLSSNGGGGGGGPTGPGLQGSTATSGAVNGGKAGNSFYGSAGSGVSSSPNVLGVTRAYLNGGGGGGAGWGNNSGCEAADGGAAEFGGGGGGGLGGTTVFGAGGVSAFGGSGGAGRVAGSAPGGGGGGGAVGARGECRVTYL